MRIRNELNKKTELNIILGRLYLGRVLFIIDVNLRLNANAFTFSFKLALKLNFNSVIIAKYFYSQHREQDMQNKFSTREKLFLLCIRNANILAALTTQLKLYCQT